MDPVRLDALFHPQRPLGDEPIAAVMDVLWSWRPVVLGEAFRRPFWGAKEGCAAAVEGRVVTDHGISHTRLFASLQGGAGKRCAERAPCAIVSSVSVEGL